MRQTRSRTILGVSAAIAIVFLTGGFAGYKAKTLIQDWRVQRYLASERAEFVNKAVPDVATRTLGETPWRLADHRGKVVLVDFWQDHCSPCIGEIPFLQEVFRKYEDRDDFIMVGVSLDASSETAAVSTKRYHRPWLQLHEKDAGWDNALAQALPVTGIPSVCLIDRDGTLLDIRLRGFNILRAVERALVTQPGGTGGAIAGHQPTVIAEQQANGTAG